MLPRAPRSCASCPARSRPCPGEHGAVLALGAAERRAAVEPLGERSGEEGRHVLDDHDRGGEVARQVGEERREGARPSRRGTDRDDLRPSRAPAYGARVRPASRRARERRGGEPRRRESCRDDFDELSASGPQSARIFGISSVWTRLAATRSLALTFVA